jgi:hypothetical protein
VCARNRWFSHLRRCFGLSLVQKLFANSIDVPRSGNFVVTLVEFRFRLTVRDRVGADTFLLFLLYCVVVIVVVALSCIVFPSADG